MGFSKLYLPFFKEVSRLIKSKILIKRTDCLITVTTGFFDHIQDGSICCRNCRCSLTNINTLRANSFSFQIIRSCRTALDIYTYNGLFIHDIITTFHKHSNIWPHSIPIRRQTRISKNV